MEAIMSNHDHIQKRSVVAEEICIIAPNGNNELINLEAWT